MFDPILVPLDGSLLAECVLPHVVAIARAFDAKVILLRVLDKNQASEKAQLFDLLNWQINKTGAKLYLEKISARLQKSGLRIETAVLEGLVAESITEYALSQGIKLIILSSHGRSGLSQWGISSVTQKIIFSAPTSVLIIRAHQPATSELIEWQYTRIAGSAGWVPSGGKCSAHGHAFGPFSPIPDSHRACRENAGNGAPNAPGPRRYGAIRSDCGPQSGGSHPLSRSGAPAIAPGRH